MSEKWLELTAQIVKPTLENISCPLFDLMNIQVSTLRLDSVHSLLSGNKWYKLKHNLQVALQKGYQTLASFGGAYSNHIHALAAAGQLTGINTVGFIKGYANQPLNPTLSDAMQWGMQLHWLNKLNYQHRYEEDYWQALEDTLALSKPVYWIPEGGSNQLGVEGCRDILLDMPEYQQFDVIMSACGTGATLAGIISAALPHQQVIGVPVLKAEKWLQQAIADWLLKVGHQNAQWKLLADCHEGGYAKITPELVTFMDEFTKRTHIPLDPIYTAKMMKALFYQLENHEIAPYSRVLVIHTGGLQGCRGMVQQLEKYRVNYK